MNIYRHKEKNHCKRVMNTAPVCGCKLALWDINLEQLLCCYP